MVFSPVLNRLKSPAMGELKKPKKNICQHPAAARFVADDIAASGGGNSHAYIRCPWLNYGIIGVDSLHMRLSRHRKRICVCTTEIHYGSDVT